MKKILLFVLMIGCVQVYARGEKDLKNQQRKQEKIIESARKRNQISENEYRKLLNEQHVIKQTIRKYEVDQYWTPHELNVVKGKLDRAENRLRRYKNNGEVY